MSIIPQFLENKEKQRVYGFEKGLIQSWRCLQGEVSSFPSNGSIRRLPLVAGCSSSGLYLVSHVQCKDVWFPPSSNKSPELHYTDWLGPEQVAGVREVETADWLSLFCSFIFVWFCLFTFPKCDLLSLIKRGVTKLSGNKREGKAEAKVIFHRDWKQISGYQGWEKGQGRGMA